MEDGSRRNDAILEADDGATMGSSAVSLFDQRRHEAGGDDPVRLRRLVDLLLRYINLAVR